MSASTGPFRSELDDPLIVGSPPFGEVTQRIAEIPEAELKNTPKWWPPVFFVASNMAGVTTALIFYLVWEGVGVWGVSNPVSWGWAIVNFVWWVGIGHAGTLISAILFLLRQRWRTAINRFAEAMTIVAVICAGMFPGVHLGRAWLAYWFFPLPNQMQMWPNFRSPLEWDIFAISTYFTVSLLFWYVGLVPDFATLRDRATNKIRQIIYGALSLGWRGGNRHWQHYEKAYLILAGISTPLVLSVHTIVSMDFATSLIPGWHTTIFPPYFVAGAIFSGFSMVVTLVVITRKLYGLEDYFTIRHLDAMNKVILATGMMVGYAYGCEFFVAWYSGNIYERAIFINRAMGPYAWAYWSMVTCNVVIPQLFWFKKFRRNLTWMFISSILVNIGMWFERFVITVTSLAQDFMPSAWDYFSPTWHDISMYIGSMGIFLTFFLLFLRFMPMIAIAEIKGVLPHADPHHGHDGHDDDGHDHSSSDEAVTHG